MENSRSTANELKALIVINVDTFIDLCIKNQFVEDRESNLQTKIVELGKMTIIIHAQINVLLLVQKVHYRYSSPRGKRSYANRQVQVIN